MTKSDNSGGNSNSNNHRRRNKDESTNTLDVIQMNKGNTHPKSKPFHLLTSSEIHDRLRLYSSTYPDLVTLKRAQDDFKYVPLAAGGDDDCPFEKNIKGCPNDYLVIEDKTMHRINYESWSTLPEIFLSGSVHGNERVGPTAVVETVGLLLESAACEAMGPSLPVNDTLYWLSSSMMERNKDTPPGFHTRQAEKCRTKLRNKWGVDDDERRWMARLVSTRRIVVLPVANALGYYRNQREENNIDINRDFPFDHKDPSKCMRTIGGRVVNEIFRQHMFRLALTYHGGMEIIGYEWGAPTYMNKLSPDEISQVAISTAYSNFAGGFDNTPPYNHASMNDKVYPVRGGMEDWAYAGSWDHDRVVQCNPGTYGGYPIERTMYENGTLRCLNMLVETSDNKIPKKGLGYPSHILKGCENKKGLCHPLANGHVTRNVRLAVAAIELVEPYASIVAVDDLRLSNDIVPRERSCKKFRSVLVPRGAGNVTVSWTVGGGITVDQTTLVHAEWADVNQYRCGSPHEVSIVDGASHESPILQGKTRWHKHGSSVSGGDGSDGKEGTEFSTTIDLNNYQPGTRVAVFAKAVVDGDWGKIANGPVAPDILPTSHVVNIRTDETWRIEGATEGSGGTGKKKIVQGRTIWFSFPLTLTLMKQEPLLDLKKKMTEPMGLIELSDRLHQVKFKVMTDAPKVGTDTFEDHRADHRALYTVIVVVIVSSIIAFLVKKCIKKNRHRRHRIFTKRSDDYQDNPLQYKDDETCVELREMN